MLLNQPCQIQSVEVKDLEKIQDKDLLTSRNLFNQALELQGVEKLPEINNVPIKNKGLLFSLWSPATGKTYQRFMPREVVQELVDGLEINDNDLEFFAEKMRNRKEPINITVLASEIEEQEYKQALENNSAQNIKLKMIGKPQRKERKK